VRSLTLAIPALFQNDSIVRGRCIYELYETGAYPALLAAFFSLLQTIMVVAAIYGARRSAGWRASCSSVRGTGAIIEDQRLGPAGTVSAPANAGLTARFRPVPSSPRKQGGQKPIVNRRGHPSTLTAPKSFSRNVAGSAILQYTCARLGAFF